MATDDPFEADFRFLFAGALAAAPDWVSRSALGSTAGAALPFRAPRAGAFFGAVRASALVRLGAAFLLEAAFRAGARTDVAFFVAFRDAGFPAGAFFDAARARPVVAVPAVRFFPATFAPVFFAVLADFPADAAFFTDVFFAAVFDVARLPGAAFPAVAFLVAAFLVAAFFGAAFFGAAFFGVAFRAAVFFAAVFLVAGFRAAVFFLAADLAVVFLVAFTGVLLRGVLAARALFDRAAFFGAVVRDTDFFFGTALVERVFFAAFLTGFFDVSADFLRDAGALAPDPELVRPWLRVDLPVVLRTAFAAVFRDGDFLTLAFFRAAMLTSHRVAGTRQAPPAGSPRTGADGRKGAG